MNTRIDSDTRGCGILFGINECFGILGMYISIWMHVSIKKINHKVPFYRPESCKSILHNRVIDHNFI